MPKPKKGESRKKYVSRCIKRRQHEHPKEKTNRSAAACYSMYRRSKGRKRRKKRKRG